MTEGFPRGGVHHLPLIRYCSYPPGRVPFGIVANNSFCFQFGSECGFPMSCSTRVSSGSFLLSFSNSRCSIASKKSPRVRLLRLLPGRLLQLAVQRGDVLNCFFRNVKGTVCYDNGFPVILLLFRVHGGISPDQIQAAKVDCNHF